MIAALDPAHRAVVEVFVAEFVAPLGVSSGWTRGLADVIAAGYDHDYPIRSIKRVLAGLRGYGLEPDSGCSDLAAAVRLVRSIRDGIQLTTVHDPFPWT